MTYVSRFFLWFALAVLTGADHPNEAAPTDRQIKQWIEKLASESFRERDAATQALLKAGPRVLPAVTELRDHPDAEVRVRARIIVTQFQTVALDIKVGSGRSCQPVRGLKSGERLYNDRPYTFTKVPEALADDVFIMTANDDAESQGDRFLSFSVLQDVVVFIAHDVRHAEMPAWMRVGRKDGFQATEMKLGCTDTTFRLYQKRFKRGRVVLGGNTDDGRSGRSNYVAIIRPAPLKTPAKPNSANGVKKRR